MRVDRQRVLDVGDAEPADGDKAAGHDPQRQPWYAVLLHPGLGQRHERGEAGVGGLGGQFASRDAERRNQCDGEAGRGPGTDEGPHARFPEA